jgi:hypothetical protein
MKTQICLLALVLAPVAAVSDDARVESSKATAPQDTPFKGKILSIATRTPENSGGMFTSVTVKRLGERVFLVGDAADPGVPGYRFRGVRMWVPIEEVVQILEFTSIEQAKRVVPFAAFKSEAPAKRRP